jgi:hypothetical protein
LYDFPCSISLLVVMPFSIFLLPPTPHVLQPPPLPPLHLQDLYINYDCDVQCTNLFEAVCRTLAAHATPGWGGYHNPSSITSTHTEAAAAAAPSNSSTAHNSLAAAAASGASSSSLPSSSSSVAAARSALLLLEQANQSLPFGVRLASTNRLAVSFMYM